MKQKEVDMKPGKISGLETKRSRHETWIDFRLNTWKLTSVA